MFARWRILSAVLGVWTCLVGCSSSQASNASVESVFQATKDRVREMLSPDAVTPEVKLPEPKPSSADRRPRTRIAPRSGTAPGPASAPAASPEPAIPDVGSSVELANSSNSERTVEEFSVRDLCVQSDFLREAVTLRDAFVYVKASQEQTPVTTLASGIMVTVTGRSDEWLIVGFNYLGERRAHWLCALLRLQSTDERAERGATCHRVKRRGGEWRNPAALSFNDDEPECNPAGRTGVAPVGLTIRF